jgi:membrane protein implicated in regulation of membrane protease activity
VLAWLVLLAALAVVVGVLAGIAWWESLAIVVGVGVISAIVTRALLRRPP